MKRRAPRAASPSIPARAPAALVRAPGTPGARLAPLALLGMALILAGAAWLQAAALRAPFFADDFVFLDHARGRSLATALAAPDPIGNYFRPVSRQLWFGSLGALTGDSPLAFHLANLALLVLIVALVFRLARRLLPAHAALAAAGALAVHHAADVPLLWASGSQDLLAVAGALLAIELSAAGRQGWAAVPLLLGLLSKETVVSTPLVAALYGRLPREPIARALVRVWPLVAALATWLGLWLLTLTGRPAMGQEALTDPTGLPAALLHLAQAALGAEWPRGDLAAAFRAPPPLAVVLVALGALVGGWRAAAPGSGISPRRITGSEGKAARLGLAWALLGALPLVPVAHIWSAYHYLFALCGVALALGAAIARLPSWTAIVPVLLVGWTSENARRIPEFATARDPWTTQSHLNRHYLERGMVMAMRCLDDLRAARPSLPPRSSLYFAGLPAAIGFQSGDGPLVRWAYRDSSLRSHFLTGFRAEHARRGPVFFFQWSQDTLTEIQGADSLERIGYGLMLSDAAGPAREVLAMAWEFQARSETAYRLAFLEAEGGDLAACEAWLEAIGFGTGYGPAPQIPAALAYVAAGDTAAATAVMERGVFTHGLDPGAHALLSDLQLSRGQLDRGTVEAYAARALAPGAPSMWKRWGLVAMAHRRDGQALAALERYIELGGEVAAGDEEVRQVMSELRRRLPGGDLAQAALHEARARADQ